MLCPALKEHPSGGAEIGSPGLIPGRLGNVPGGLQWQAGRKRVLGLLHLSIGLVRTGSQTQNGNQEQEQQQADHQAAAVFFHTLIISAIVVTAPLSGYNGWRAKLLARQLGKFKPYPLSVPDFGMPTGISRTRMMEKTQWI